MEEVKVKIVKDDGSKNRWGIGKFMYKSDGRKNSLNTKILAIFVGCLIAISSLYSILSEFYNPTLNIQGDVITFNGTLQNNPSEGAYAVSEPGTYKNAPGPHFGNKKISKILLGSQIIQRSNSLKVPPGTMVKAQLITNASNGSVKALLTDPILINGEEVISVPATLIGLASSQDDRLIIRFTKILDKNGVSFPIEALACDESDQTAGIKGKKISRSMWLMTSQVGLSLLSGASQAAQSTNAPTANVELKTQLKNTAISEASKAALDQSQNLLNDFKNQKSIIQVDSGTAFYLLFEGD